MSKSEKKKDAGNTKEKEPKKESKGSNKVVLSLIIAGIVLVAAGAAMFVKQKSAEKEAMKIVEDLQKRAEQLSGECSTADDCEGLPHIMCVGEWSCEQGMCSYKCESENLESETEDENQGGESQAVEDNSEQGQEEKKEEEPEPVFLEVPESSMSYVEEEVKTKFVAMSPTFKKVTRGTTFETAFGIKNGNVKEEKFRINAVFRRAYTDDGRPILGLNEDELSLWVDSGGEFTVKPKESRIVKMRVAVPLDEPPEKGTYEFSVQAQKMTHKWEDYYGKFYLAVKVE